MTASSSSSGRANLRRLLPGVAVAALLALGGWYGWRWYRTPVPPAVPLNGLSEQTAEVVNKATRRVRSEPRSGKAWGELGLALIATGNREQALECLGHARRFDPEQPRWAYWQGETLLRSDPRAAIGHFREALALASDRDQRASILFALALALLEAEQLDEAQKHLRALSEIDPEGPRVHFGLGLLAVARDDRAAVREHLGKVVEVPFARKRACSLLASVADDAKQAEEYRGRVAELPGDADWPTAFQGDLVPYQLDLVPPLTVYRNLEEQGRKDEALAYLRNVAAQSPDEPVCFLLGVVLLGRNELSEAVQAFRQVLRFNPRHTKAHILLATVLLRQAEKEEEGGRRRKDLGEQALHAADAALSIQRDQADAHLARGYALKHLGRRDESLAAFREAVLRGPEHAETHQALGEALAESGQLKEGLEYLENAVRHARPQDARPQQALDKWRAKAKKVP